ncbi:hypothetical protein NM688_g2116 [Phlebia brevispora]|uniref:Uncharacterized protein n=1 Tax=Phlebia brevispora TaxID=194682 RepID=A0ACC1T971_9APHY|nr:hypothetical protein NM688_g2116 [Phlebia brevispora]
MVQNLPPVPEPPVVLPPPFSPRARSLRSSHTPSLPPLHRKPSLSVPSPPLFLSTDSIAPLTASITSQLPASHPPFQTPSGGRGLQPEGAAEPLNALFIDDSAQKISLMQDRRQLSSHRSNPTGSRLPLRSGYLPASNSSLLPVPRPVQRQYPNSMQLGGSPPYIPEPAPRISDQEEDYFDRYRPLAAALQPLGGANYNRPGDTSMVLNNIEEGWAEADDRFPSPWEPPVGDMIDQLSRHGSAFYSHPSHSPSLPQSVGFLEGIDDVSTSARSRASSVVSSNYRNSEPTFLHPSATYGSQLSSGVNAGHVYSSGSRVSSDSYALRAEHKSLDTELTPGPSSSSRSGHLNDAMVASASEGANPQPHSNVPSDPSRDGDLGHVPQIVTIVPVPQPHDYAPQTDDPTLSKDLAHSKTERPELEMQSGVQFSMDGSSLALEPLQDDFMNVESQGDIEHPPSMVVESESVPAQSHATATSEEEDKLKPSQKRVTNALAKKIKTDLQAVYTLLDEVAQKYDISMEKMVRMHRSSLQHRSGIANTWNWYESYFAGHEEQELRRCFSEERIAEIQAEGVVQAIRSACWKQFKKRYPDTYSDILFTYHLKTIVEETGEQTVHQRHRAFQQYTSQLREQAETAHITYNFETAWVAVGSNAHQDDRNAAMYETKYLEGLFQRTTRSKDASEFMGHARAQSLMGISQQTVEENLSNATSAGASKVPAGPSKSARSLGRTDATGPAKLVEPGAEPDGNAHKDPEELWLSATSEEVAQLSDEDFLAFIKVRFDHLLAQHTTTQLRSSSKQAVKNVPWQTLPGKLIDWGVRLLNWPSGVRCPGTEGSSSRKGISTLNKDERRTLAMAFIDPSQPIQMEKIDTKDKKGDYIVAIDSVAPPADAADEYGVRIQVLQRDHRVVKATRGLPRLCPSTPQPRHAVIQSSKDADVPAKRSIQSDNEDEIEVLDTPTPRPGKKRRLDRNVVKHHSSIEISETSDDDDLGTSAAPQLQDPPSRDLALPRKAVVELTLRSKGKERDRTSEHNKPSDLRVYRPMPDLDLIAPMIRGTTHTVRPRPVVKRSQASLSSAAPQDEGRDIATTSRVAGKRTVESSPTPEQSVPRSLSMDSQSTRGQTGLSTNLSSDAQASSPSEEELSAQGRPEHPQTSNSSAAAYPAAANIPIPPQFLTFMQQLFQAQQGSAPSNGPFTSIPQISAPSLLLPFGASDGNANRLPFGSSPTLPRESGSSGQPAQCGSSNRSSSFDQTVSLPGGSTQSKGPSQPNAQRPK